MNEPLSEMQMRAVEHGTTTDEPDTDIDIEYSVRVKSSYYAMNEIMAEQRDNPLTKTSQGYCEVYQFLSDDPNEKRAGCWYAVRVSNGGGSGSTAYATKEEAADEIRRMVAGTRRFWNGYAARVKSGVTESGERIIRCDGEHYVVGHAYKGGGFGGQRFVFALLDWEGVPTGHLVESCNVWHQGRIPTDYRDRLRDNAWLVTQ